MSGLDKKAVHWNKYISVYLEVVATQHQSPPCPGISCTIIIHTVIHKPVLTLLANSKTYIDYDDDILTVPPGGTGWGGEARVEATVGTYIHLASSGGGERAYTDRKNA